MKCIAHRGARAAAIGVVAVALIALPAHGQATTADKADHLFLHEMADLNKGVALLAHGAMHRPGTSPSKTQAGAVDKRHDDEMDHITAALKMIADSYVPRASRADSTTAADLTKQGGAAYDAAFRTDVRQIDQRAIKTIDLYMPQLTNATIKTLAQRLRASADEEAKGFE